jgi:hypothetical protein
MIHALVRAAKVSERYSSRCTGLVQHRKRQNGPQPNYNGEVWAQTQAMVAAVCSSTVHRHVPNPTTTRAPMQPYVHDYEQEILVVQCLTCSCQSLTSCHRHQTAATAHSPQLTAPQARTPELVTVIVSYIMEAQTQAIAGK